VRTVVRRKAEQEMRGNSQLLRSVNLHAAQNFEHEDNTKCNQVFHVLPHFFVGIEIGRSGFG
jgi:hypothetical protein